MKTKFEDYTEQEFLDFMNAFFSNPDKLKGKAFERRSIQMVEHFEKITEHPAGSDVIFYPEEGHEHSPEGILKTVKEWRLQNGKPGFKMIDKP